MATDEVIRRPQEWLHLVLSGQIPLEDAPPAIQSWARFPIYQGAVEIVRMDTKEERTAALLKVPPPVRGLVEEEVRRVWRWRGEV